MPHLVGCPSLGTTKSPVSAEPPKTLRSMAASDGGDADGLATRFGGLQLHNVALSIGEGERVQLVPSLRAMPVLWLNPAHAQQHTRALFPFPWFSLSCCAAVLCHISALTDIPSTAESDCPRRYTLNALVEQPLGLQDETPPHRALRRAALVGVNSAPRPSRARAHRPRQLRIRNSRIAGRSITSSPTKAISSRVTPSLANESPRTAFILNAWPW